jgi:hypothetical protein
MFTVVRRFRLILALVSTVAAVATPCRAAGGDTTLPAASLGSVQFAPELRAYVDRMLAHSATFRAQYQRVVEHPGVIVSGRFDPTINERTFRALSTIRRYDSGLLVVSMAISPSAHVDEYIAHEFEHILEQIEGLDLPELARRHSAGIWFSGPSLIETSRAVRAGRAVSDEMRARDPRPDNLVQ